MQRELKGTETLTSFRVDIVNDLDTRGSGLVTPSVLNHHGLENSAYLRPIPEALRKAIDVVLEKVGDVCARADMYL